METKKLRELDVYLFPISGYTMKRRGELYEHKESRGIVCHLFYLPEPRRNIKKI